MRMIVRSKIKVIPTLIMIMFKMCSTTCVIDFNAFKNALPDEIFNDLRLPLQRVKKWERTQQGTLKEGKLPTYWMDLSEHPKYSIEQAVTYLYRYVNSSIQNLKERKSCDKIIGAEWWIQDRSPTESIDFHYDKDEGLASTGKMKHPLVSTVTYISSIGAPTVIFNMSSPNARVHVPISPVSAHVVYPQANTHVLFR